jgi:hypothetical protein
VVGIIKTKQPPALPKGKRNPETGPFDYKFDELRR